MKKYSQTKGAIAQRLRRNELKLSALTRDLDIFGSDTRIARGLLQGKGNLGSASTTRRLNKIRAQINSGSFNIKRRIGQNKEIKSKTNNINPKEYQDMSARDILASYNRSEFYRENKDDLTRFNNEGRDANSPLAREIRENYTDYENSQLDVLANSLDD